MWVAPAADLMRGRQEFGREALCCCCRAVLTCLHWQPTMIGNGAHRRQGGSQLAAEPACSRRVRAPSETWGDGCSRQVGEATTRRVTWAWGSPDLFGDVRVSLRDVRSTAPCPPPLRLINSIEQTSTGPSHGKVMASLSYEPLGVCSLVRRQTPVGHVRAHVTRESHQPVRQQRGYDKWWNTAATPDSTRMTQVSLYIALNNFVPLHCATWILGVPG